VICFLRFEEYSEPCSDGEGLRNGDTAFGKPARMISACDSRPFFDRADQVASVLCLAEFRVTVGGLITPNERENAIESTTVSKGMAAGDECKTPLQRPFHQLNLRAIVDSNSTARGTFTEHKIV
jgi:hypothetical protein